MTDQTNANDIQEVMAVTGILQYAYFAAPYKNKDGKLSYKTAVLMDPTASDVARVKAAQRKVALAAWEAESELTLARLGAQDKLALHDGNLQKDEAFKGKVFLSCNAKKPPSIVVTMGGARLQAEIAKALQIDPKTAWANTARANNMTVANVPIGPDSEFYPRSTDKAVVHIAIYAQSPKRKPVDWGERINCQLMGVQFLERGAGLGGGGRVARIDEFGINPVDADADIPAEAPATGNAAGLF